MFVAAAMAAPPRFVGGEPKDAELALAAWTAAVECTGWEPSAHDTVKLRRVVPEYGFGGFAYSDASGLFRIDLHPKARPSTLAHEIGHAWFSSSSSMTLNEGRAEVLAECISRSRPALFPAEVDAKTELTHLPDLISWDSYDMSGAALTDAYAGSTRLMRSLSDIVGEQVIWQEPERHWDPIIEALETSGEAGQKALAALTGGADAQRRALKDRDKDGLSTLQEWIRGTDPALWDTDGDGWWDGVPLDRPSKAVPLPPDGSYVCIPYAVPEQYLVTVRMGGSSSEGGEAHYANTQQKIWQVMRMPEEMRGAEGGLWVEVIGDGLVPNPFCYQGEQVLLTSHEELFGDMLQRFGPALQTAIDDAEQRLGIDAGSISVRLDWDLLRVTAYGGMVGYESIKVPEPMLLAYAKQDRMDALASQVVAVHLLARTNKRALEHPAAAGALVHLLVDDMPRGKPMVKAHPSEIREWRKKTGDEPAEWVKRLE